MGKQDIALNELLFRLRERCASEARVAEERDALDAADEWSEFAAELDEHIDEDSLREAAA